MDIAKEVVEKLIEKNKTISSMESCTGGGFVNAITNIKGASQVIKFAAVTYSNEYKIKMGVNKKLIDEKSVYSIEVAKDMSLKISEFANSDYGIGITGKLGTRDPNNLEGDNNVVFISIYDRKEYHTFTISVSFENRNESKLIIINHILKKLKEII